MVHLFVKARFRGRDEIEFERILVDTGASFTLNESLAL
jgi:predicted aspartyl protease